jgi:hypothetical protein
MFCDCFSLRDEAKGMLKPANSAAPAPLVPSIVYGTIVIVTLLEPDA